MITLSRRAPRDNNCLKDARPSICTLGDQTMTERFLPPRDSQMPAEAHSPGWGEYPSILSKPCGHQEGLAMPPNQFNHGLPYYEQAGQPSHPNRIAQPLHKQPLQAATTGKPSSPFGACWAGCSGVDSPSGMRDNSFFALASSGFCRDGFKSCRISSSCHSPPFRSACPLTLKQQTGRSKRKGSIRTPETVPSGNSRESDCLRTNAKTPTG